MSPDFTGQVPSPEDAVHTFRPDNLPMAVTALVSLLALFLLASFILFTCRSFSADAADPAAASPPEMLRERAAATAPGLVAATVAALPVVLAAGEGCCAVCLGAYGAAERVKLMPVCRHKFHPGCIDTWLLSRGSCPVCRCSELGGAGEIRVDVFGSKWETEEEEDDDAEEEEEEIGPSRKLRRSRSSSSRVEMEGIGKAMVFLRHSCSF
ncbi:RING-H2 finger protein ATL72 [Platanthera zijinensis]|uniref:RING-type E3 ubiquitin transferase n=1 Tax=Platanthera zijinensis TaxID=2320716 RepID=A0AAP0BM09_9ASPA